ncbi:MAG: ATP-binding cassette domain-containing protein [Gammaproteobacteria bacterium]|nr:MAG: ATP-binding cassette domain-containing protein [Gammaproteobacteria bacterium]
MSQDCIQLSNVEFCWGNNQPSLFNIESLTLRKAEKLFIHGPSGCGKTTLLNLISGVLMPTRGDILVLGNNMFSQKQKLRDQYRADHMGIIFQQFNLIPYLNVLENITLPCLFSWRRREMLSIQKRSSTDEALRLLAALGLKDKDIIFKNVTELSAGQQQRVAAARALIGSPEIIIADEPTSALDQDAKQGFLELLFDEAKKSNSALLFVSHDLTLSNLFDRSVSLNEFRSVENA